jgi:hypothetical protein
LSKIYLVKIIYCAIWVLINIGGIINSENEFHIFDK